jgi:hypothetical protein
LSIIYSTAAVFPAPWVPGKYAEVKSPATYDNLKFAEKANGVTMLTTNLLNLLSRLERRTFQKTDISLENEEAEEENNENG